MQYENLRKAFYKNRQTADSLYKSRFNNENSVHIDIDISGYPAFFVMDTKIYEYIIRLAKTDKAILDLTHSLPGKAIEQFTVNNLIEEIVITNNIEGVHSTRREIGDVLRNLQEHNRHMRFKGLVNKYLMLSDKYLGEIRTPNEIREIYDELVSDEIYETDPKNDLDGEIFRSDPVSVYDKAGKEIHRGSHPESKIIQTMETALEFLNNKSVNGIARIAAFHFLFGYIHPFYDGNGRVNRYISSQYLSKECERIMGYGLSYTIRSRIDEYYKAFEETEHTLNRGDLTPFVTMFCDIVSETAERIKESLSCKKLDFNTYEKAAFDIMPQKILSNQDMRTLVSILIQAALFSEDGISTKELVSFFNVTRATISNRLKTLDGLLTIKKKKIGREVFYQADINTLK